MMGDGTMRTGTCVRVNMQGHPDGAYVTLVLDDQYGRPRTIDTAPYSAQVYVNELQIEWLN
jgi:hypothetical protein